ncbi:MAG: YceI family protein [Alphaproteobacteria bacterium]
MRPWIFLLAFVGALLPGAAFAAKWVMRPKESSIVLQATFLGSPLKAEFKKFTAAIEFDPADLSRSSADVRIDTASFDSQNDDRDEFVTEEPWFYVARFPEARFVTRSIRFVSASRYEAVADLTIRGVTKSVTLPFTVAIEGGVARMSGAINLVRTEFGVGQGEWASSDQVGGTVAVSIAVVADRAP